MEIGERSKFEREEVWRCSGSGSGSGGGEKVGLWNTKKREESNSTGVTRLAEGRSRAAESRKTDGRWSKWFTLDCEWSELVPVPKERNQKKGRQFSSPVSNILGLLVVDGKTKKKRLGQLESLDKLVDNTRVIHKCSMMIGIALYS